jgi:hypothetical protein
MNPVDERAAEPARSANHLFALALREKNSGKARFENRPRLDLNQLSCLRDAAPSLLCRATTSLQNPANTYYMNYESSLIFMLTYSTAANNLVSNWMKPN